MNNNEQNPTGPPPPPELEMKMRTMESDVESMKQTGGGMPEPQIINPAELGGGGPIFKPETTVAEATASETQPGKTRRWLVWAFVAVLIIFAGVLSYLYVWPLIFPQAPIVTPTTEVATAPEEVAEVAPVVVHTSVVGTANENIAKLTVADDSVVSIMAALQATAAEAQPADSVKEVVFEIGGGLATAKKFFETLLPELEDSDFLTMLEAAFNKDFTTLLYFDDKGVWPIYIVKRSDAGFPVDTSVLANLETVSISNLYLTPPAGTAEAFRSGQAGGRFSTRYAVYPEVKPASFNYGLLGDYLVLTTTYGGMQKAVELLGL